MKLTATLGANLRQILQAEVDAAERAVSRAIGTETEALKRTLRAQVNAAFGTNAKPLANAWRSQTFPRRGVSMRASGIVWTKVPTIIDAFERGATIRAKGGKFLAIPTGFNRAGGRRGSKPRVTPAQMVASKQAFVRPFKGGRGFVWCLPVRQGERVGRRRAPLIAGRITQVATAKRKGAAAWQANLLKQGFVPMFLLVPQVQLAKRLDVRSAGAAALARLPAAVVAAWEAETRRAA